VKPEEKTAVLLPRNISAFGERKFIACYVISAPRNVMARNAIRSSWGKLIRPIFMIGKSDNATMTNLAHEAEAFNDIIVEDFVDSYINLTIKTAFAMKNFLNSFNSSTYFLKIDDDVFLNVEKLHKLLEKVPKDALIGKAESNRAPIRDVTDKWYLPEFLFEEECLPKYLHGPAYLIPGTMIEIDSCLLKSERIQKSSKQLTCHHSKLFRSLIFPVGFHQNFPPSSLTTKTIKVAYN
jgi:hypothetical protein